MSQYQRKFTYVSNEMSSTQPAMDEHGGPTCHVGETYLDDCGSFIVS